MRNLRTLVVYMYILIASILLFIEPVRELWTMNENLRIPVGNILFLSFIGVMLFYASVGRKRR